MPHFQIEYSANLEAELDIGGLCEAIRRSASKIATFPTAGIRVRATRVDHYAIADGAEHHAFIDISIRLRGGRPDDVKQDATQRIFETAQDYVQTLMDQRSLALSLEMRDIDPELSPKAGSIRDHMKGADD